MAVIFITWYSQLRSRLPSLSNSLMIGRTGGHALRLPRRLPMVKRPSVTSVNGRLKSLPSLSSRVTRVSWQRARLLTTPSRHPSRPPLTSATSPLLSNMRSNIKRVVTAVVVTSSFWKMVSRLAARSSLTLLLGLSCSAPILLALGLR